MNLPKRILSVDQWREVQHQEIEKRHLRLGFVPTMGALHEGHMSLIRRSRAENDKTVVSIFVNPSQFNNPDDYKTYPLTLENDLELLSREQVDYVFLPRAEELYEDHYRFRVYENQLSKELEGEFRPGHFEGVLTIVLKLFNILQPTKTYFGEKDFQQLKLVQEMARSLFLNLEVIGCPTIRDENGLALSSRNQRLSTDELKHAAQFPEILQKASSSEEAASLLAQSGFKIDYVEDLQGRRFGAVHLGKVRLIDNVKL